MTNLWQKIVQLLTEQLQDPAIHYLPQLRLVTGKRGELLLTTDDEVAEFVVRKNLLPVIERLAVELAGGQIRGASLIYREQGEPEPVAPPVSDEEPAQFWGSDYFATRQPNESSAAYPGGDITISAPSPVSPQVQAPRADVPRADVPRADVPRAHAPRVVEPRGYEHSSGELSLADELANVEQVSIFPMEPPPPRVVQTQALVDAPFSLNFAPVAAPAPPPVGVIAAGSAPVSNYTAASEERILSAGLQRQHNFGTFVSGSSNEFAYEAAKAVASSLGAHSNPLVFCGGPGLGKTHLINAIGLEVLSQNPNCRVRFISAETFVNELIASIKSNQMDNFRSRNRLNVDLLLVDDIQFILGKDKSQEEFFHTFNDLHKAGHQIVLTADRRPRDMPELEERLITRLSMGLIADIHPPDLETRIAILSRFAESRKLSVNDQVLNYVANMISSNVRELHGAMNNLHMQSRIQRKPLTLEFAEEILGELVEEQRARVTPDMIVSSVSEVFSVRRADIMGRGRSALVAQARKVAMYLCREYTEASYPELGRYFSRDHSTVLAAHRSIRETIDTDKQLLTKIKGVQARLG